MNFSGLCGSDSRSGYMGKLDLQNDDSSEEITMDCDEATSCSNGICSAVLSSIKPKLTGIKNETAAGKPAYDAYGFETSSGESNAPPEDDSQTKLQWIAYLEFSTSGSQATEFKFDTAKIVELERTDKLRDLVMQGIPHSLRPKIWMLLSGAADRKSKSRISYIDIVKQAAGSRGHEYQAIEKEVRKVFSGKNVCFSGEKSAGNLRLKRVSRALTWVYPSIGYCSEFNQILPFLLLFLEENDCFWLMCAAIERVLPAAFFAMGMLGAKAQQKVFVDVLDERLPETAVKLRTEDIDISLITLPWMSSLFCSAFDMKSLLYFWDWFLFEGSAAFFQALCGMLMLKRMEIQNLESAELLNFLYGLPKEIGLSPLVIRMGVEALQGWSDAETSEKYNHYLGNLLLASGSHFSATFPFNMPNQVILDAYLDTKFAETHVPGSQIMIRRTELMARLREVVNEIVRHFEQHDKQMDLLTAQSVSSPYSGQLSSDLSVHELDALPDLLQHDREAFHGATRCRTQRARALVDFERTADDELGFRTNDIIQVVSRTDDHCWIGELNGIRGWFPARFVELLDERGKSYCPAGDEALHGKELSSLIRGKLNDVVMAVLSDGLQTSFLKPDIHPWTFIARAAKRPLEQQAVSAHARMYLCSSFKIDEDGRVLNSTELLHKVVDSIDLQFPDSALDRKLCELLIIALNNQSLHLWLSELCATGVVEQWYDSKSLLRSPVWAMVLLEVRRLSELCFILKTAVTEEPRTIGFFDKGVEDLLVRYHLFSWELG